MRQLLTCLLFISSFCLAGNWETDYEVVLKKSKELSKPVLIDFYADWCGPCKMMDKDVLPAEAVVKELEGYLLLKINTDENRDLQLKYEAQGIPQFTILNRHQERLDDVVGYQDVDKFIKWLQVNKDAAFSDARINELSTEEKQLIKDFSLNPVKSLEVLSGKLKNANDDKRDMLLRALSEIDSESLLPSLEHPKLEVRLLASKLLVAQLKEDFVFDAWASTVERQKQFNALKEKLKK